MSSYLLKSNNFENWRHDRKSSISRQSSRISSSQRSKSFANLKSEFSNPSIPKLTHTINRNDQSQSCYEQNIGCQCKNRSNLLRKQSIPNIPLLNSSSMEFTSKKPTKKRNIYLTENSIERCPGLLS